MSVRRPGPGGRGWVAAVVLALAAPAPLAAQENPVLRSAAALAAEGRGDSARALVARELRRQRPGENGWVEALYWRARLAVSGDSAERDLRRVALEYPSSPWADDALLELAQIALAAGNPSAAFDLARRLRADYPGSDLQPRAALWAARAAFDTGEPRAACVFLDSARAEAAGDVEFINQVAWYRGRCTPEALAAPPRPAATTTPPRAAPATPGPATPPPVTSGTGWYVQVYASRAAADADGVARRLAAAELPARVVRGADGMHRVRLGPYGAEPAARDAAERARLTIGGRPFLVHQP